MAVDPLAKLLPAGDPLAVVPSARLEGQAPPAVPAPPDLASPPDDLAEEPGPPLVVDESTATAATDFNFTAPEAKADTGSPVSDSIPVIPVERPAKNRKRKRRSLAGPIMAVSVVAMFGALAFCLYLLMSNKAITPDGQVVSADRDEPNRRLNQPAGGDVPGNSQPRQPRDPIMGDMGGPAAPASSNNDREPLLGNDPAGDSPAAPMNANDNEANTPPTIEPDPQAEDSMTEPANPPAPDTVPDTDSNMAAPSEPTDPAAASDDPDTGTSNPEPMADDAVDDAGASTPTDEVPDELLADLRGLLTTGNFSGMQAAAETLQAAAETPQAKRSLAPFVTLAELAEYYAGGIRSGITKLNATETFDIVPGMEAVVVESSGEKISLKINGQVKRYTIDAMPLVLAHRLADFALPKDAPEVLAGRAAYQALWSEATVGHRLQAFDWWESIGDNAGIPNLTELEPAVRILYDLPPEE